MVNSDCALDQSLKNISCFRLISNFRRIVSLRFNLCLFVFKSYRYANHMKPIPGGYHHSFPLTRSRFHLGKRLRFGQLCAAIIVFSLGEHKTDQFNFRFVLSTLQLTLGLLRWSKKQSTAFSWYFTRDSGNWKLFRFKPRYTGRPNILFIPTNVQSLYSQAMTGWWKLFLTILLFWW